METTELEYATVLDDGTVVWAPLSAIVGMDGSLTWHPPSDWAPVRYDTEQERWVGDEEHGQFFVRMPSDGG